MLALENSRAVSSQPADGNNLLELISKRPRLPATARPPVAATGDAILLGTEAAESFLYWNGTTYRWVEAEGGE